MDTLPHVFPIRKPSRLLQIINLLIDEIEHDEHDAAEKIRLGMIVNHLQELYTTPPQADLVIDPAPPGVRPFPATRIGQRDASLVAAFLAADGEDF